MDGGLGVIDITLKIASLRASHIMKSLDDRDIGWKQFCIFWVGHQLRGYNPEFALNTRPHAFFPSPFYKEAIETIRQIENLQVVPCSVTDFKAANAYKILLRGNPIRPNIESKHPLVSFQKVWGTIDNKHLSCWARDVSYRTAHNILPVSAHLYYLHISTTPHCVCCGQVETLLHCFFDCVNVRPVWALIESWMSAVLDGPFTVSPELVRWHKTELGPSPTQDLLLVLVTELKLVIWNARNRRKFERVSTTPLDLKCLYTCLIRNRVKADFLRLPSDHFIDLWGGGTRPLAVIQDGGELCIDI